MHKIFTKVSCCPAQKKFRFLPTVALRKAKLGALLVRAAQAETTRAPNARSEERELMTDKRRVSF